MGGVNGVATGFKVGADESFAEGMQEVSKNDGRLEWAEDPLDGTSVGQ